MTISCSCDYDGEHEWYWRPLEPPKPVSLDTLCQCFSCQVSIHSGDVAQVFERWRYREDDEWEGGEFDEEGVDPDDIYDEVDLPDW